MTTVLRYAVFAETPEGGNPAGVVLGAEGLTDAERQRIAAEVGYPETAFASATEDPRRFTVRFFSPSAEVPFCGHATVATASALAEVAGAGDFVFDTAVGPVTLTAVETDDGPVVSFTSVEPDVREVAPEVLQRLLTLLTLDESDLSAIHPPRESFAGNWHPVIVLTDRELFHQFRFEAAPLADLMLEQGWSGTVTVLHDAGEGTFLARNLVPVARITEDPATGSAAAATGAYLRALGLTEPDAQVLVRQGMHVGRPSALHVTIPEAGGIIVSGTASPISG